MKRLWKCPRCGRRFANLNQTHTCARLQTLDHHFRGKPPEMKRLFHAFRRAVATFGRVKVLPEKSRIAFQVRMSFAQITPRRQWLDGHFVLDRRVPGRHVRRIETFSTRNHVHYFRLMNETQIDTEFLALAREAYDVGAQRHLERRGESV
jgi:hypothetical protein